ncbi:helix-turn-helix domain-containing protein [Nocardioides sp. WS12]|uniref:helix-turn-helix domain-containing protein n=1 Tax=Nocardioides sp. WS12 TaxID=2486272 RepID=UPI0015F842A0|nr:helix-turn-helix domain-containing protein [Nocardioides sp. WS12]
MSEQQIAASVRTLAALLDVSETTIREAINKQELPAFRVGRAIRVFVDDAKDWLRGQTRVGSEDDQ